MSYVWKATDSVVTGSAFCRICVAVGFMKPNMKQLEQGLTLPSPSIWFSQLEKDVAPTPSAAAPSGSQCLVRESGAGDWQMDWCSRNCIHLLLWTTSWAWKQNCGFTGQYPFLFSSMTINCGWVTQKNKRNCRGWLCKGAKDVWALTWAVLTHARWLGLFN